jgi:hypothetical protein
MAQPPNRALENPKPVNHDRNHVPVNFLIGDTEAAARRAALGRDSIQTD